MTDSSGNRRAVAASPFDIGREWLGPVEALIDLGVLSSADIYTVVDSTNTVALDWLRTASDAVVRRDCPRLVIASMQSAGRGRHGNVWLSADDSLTCSLIVTASGPLISIAVGLAVADAIEAVLPAAMPQLKWPNDVWLGGAKVAGVLIERISQRPDHWIIGIGVNVGSAPDFLAAPTKQVTSDQVTPTSLSAAGATATRSDVLTRLVPAVLDRLHDAQTLPLEVVEAYQTRCMLTGVDVQATFGGKPVWGRCLGIDAQGHLRLMVDDQLVSIHAGNVQRVRRVDG